MKVVIVQQRPSVGSRLAAVVGLLALALAAVRCNEAAGVAGTGEIRVSTGMPGELVLKAARGKGELRRFNSTNSVFAVPAGRYRLWTYTCLRRDAAGREWAATTGLETRDDQEFLLQANEVKVVQAGEPFKAKIVATVGPGRALALDLKLVGTDGDVYRFAPKEGKAANPGFVIKDQAGKEVLSGLFSYG